MNRQWAHRAGLAAAAAVFISVPTLLADAANEEDAIPELRALAGAAAWRDSLDAVRIPALPPAGETESAIVVLTEPAIATGAPTTRAERAAAAAAQADRVRSTLAGLGVTVYQRYRMLVNGFAVRVPTGGLSDIARLPDVAAVVPVSYLAPAESKPLAAVTASAAAAPTVAPTTETVRAAHIALIDAGIDPTHPLLGGGIGSTFKVIGGADLVGNDDDPTADVSPAAAEAHGTAMAALVLASPRLGDLPAEKIPRLLAYRVVAPELVEGRIRPLARTDRVLAALERAVDPNGDGVTDDRPEVILFGLARGFDDGGVDPVASALHAASLLDTVVVVAAGNDGPTFGPAGSIGSVAAAPGVLTVGGRSATTTPRTADLAVGGATGIGPVPLLGADPAGLSAAVVVVAGGDGLASGNDASELRDATGKSLVTGRVVLVSRGGGQLVDKARNAAAAGAVAVAVWDEHGNGVFPGTAGGDDWPLPVVGLGPRQGATLEALARGSTPPVVTISARPVETVAEHVAAFSSRGPTADGRLKPDLLAPAVDLATAFPGRAPDGRPLSTHISGTSAAAAQVAAMALRLRIDRPELRAEDVRSLIVQGGQALPGVGSVDQGTGAVIDPATAPLAIDPPVITRTRPAVGSDFVDFTLHDLTGLGGRYQLHFQGPGDTTPRDLGGPVDVPADVRVGRRLRIPAGLGAYEGIVTVSRADDAAAVPVARAILYAGQPAPTPIAALGLPLVSPRGSTSEVSVRVGLLRRAGKAIESAPLHDLGLWLVPGTGATPLALTGQKPSGALPAGDYRFLVSAKLSDGRPIAPGRYRLRVTAVGPDGTPLVRDSGAFTIK